jgi:hypothetical protein
LLHLFFSFFSCDTQQIHEGLSQEEEKNRKKCREFLEMECPLFAKEKIYWGTNRLKSILR